MKVNQFLILFFFSTVFYGPIAAQNAETLLQNMVLPMLSLQTHLVMVCTKMS